MHSHPLAYIVMGGVIGLLHALLVLCFLRLSVWRNRHLALLNDLTHGENCNECMDPLQHVVTWISVFKERRKITGWAIRDMHREPQGYACVTLLLYGLPGRGVFVTLNPIVMPMTQAFEESLQHWAQMWDEELAMTGPGLLRP